MWKKTTTAGAAWNFCRKWMKTRGVPLGLPVLSKNTPTPRRRLTGAPPMLGERRSNGASPSFSVSLGSSVSK